MTTYALNKFAVSEQKGSVKNPDKGFRYECIVYASESATLVPGDCVKLVDTAGKLPVVQKISATTDAVFGMVMYEPKKNAYVANDVITIAADYSIISCEASASIAAGANVMPVISGQKVVTATTSQKIIGKALRKATTDELFPVLLKDDGYSS